MVLVGVQSTGDATSLELEAGAWVRVGGGRGGCNLNFRKFSCEICRVSQNEETRTLGVGFGAEPPTTLWIRWRTDP